MPIRSLLGHRSQASPEVRHVSGQHFHEFREFLLKHPDAYLVEDEKETVTLKNFSTVKSHTQELHFNLNANLDPEATQTVLDFLAQCIELKGPMLVEQLFQIVSCTLPEEYWSNLFNTAAHLTSFLRLFSDSFLIQSNLVTLLQLPKVSQKHMNAQNLKNKTKPKSPTLIKNEEKPTIDNSNDTTQEVITVVKIEDDKSDKVVQSRSISDRLKQPKIQLKNEMAKAKSSSDMTDGRISSPTNSDPDTDKRGVNFRLGKYKTESPELESQERTVATRNANNQTLKQRINNLVLKTLQENTGKERHTLLNQNQESWKVKLFQNTRVICSVRECQMVIDELMRGIPKNATVSVHETEEIIWPFLDDRQVIGFDCEGINLGVKGQITIMQVATMAGFCYIFDLISCPNMIDAGLKTILENPHVIKVKIILTFSCFALTRNLSF